MAAASDDLFTASVGNNTKEIAGSAQASDNEPAEASWRSWTAHPLTAPIIYSMAVPIALLDLWVTLYQQTCFRVYGIPRVRRGDYLVLDRELLPYLTPLQRFNCAYCSYATGIIAYVAEIAARTELYWCPLKHLHEPPGANRIHREFIPYGNEESFRKWSDGQSGEPSEK